MRNNPGISHVPSPGFPLIDNILQNHRADFDQDCLLLALYGPLTSLPLLPIRPPELLVTSPSVLSVYNFVIPGMFYKWDDPYDLGVDFFFFF